MSYPVVYCITEQQDLALNTDDADLSVIRCEGLQAVVSETDKTRMRPSRANLLAHQRINELVMGQVSAALPMQFGMIADSNAAVEDILMREQATLKARLDAVRDRHEISVKVEWHQEALMQQVGVRAPELTEINVQELDINARIDLGQQVEAVAEEMHSEVRQLFREALAPHTVEIRMKDELPLTTSLDGAFLVERSEQAAFEAALEAVAARFDPDSQASVKMIGPMPVYSFADLTINLQE